MLYSVYIHACGNYEVHSLALCLPGSSVENYIALRLREQQIKGESKSLMKEEKSRKEDKSF